MKVGDFPAPQSQPPVGLFVWMRRLGANLLQQLLGRVRSLDTLVWRKILWEDSKFTLKKFPLISLPFKKTIKIPQWHLSVGLVGGWQASETLGKTLQWRYLPCLRWWISCHREDLWEERKGEKNCDYPVLSYFHVSCCSPHQQMRR